MALTKDDFKFQELYDNIKNAPVDEDFKKKIEEGMEKIVKMALDEAKEYIQKLVALIVKRYIP